MSGSDEDGDGIPDAAIVADNANGTAIDTSTGLAFNAVLAAPAGSTIVNPITTMVNELVKADTSGGDLATKIASATTSIKDAFGLTNGNLGEDLDLMNYDPIAALEENGTDAVAKQRKGLPLGLRISLFLVRMIWAGIAINWLRIQKRFWRVSPTM